jgi:hypothetical protein
MLYVKKVALTLTALALSRERLHFGIFSQTKVS